MARFIVSSSILKKLLPLVAGVLLITFVQPQLAFAQHAPGYFGGVGAHVYAPPPFYRAPLLHAPISRPYVAVAPRFAAFGTGRLLFRTQPAHRGRPVFPIIGSPFFFGWPFLGFGLAWGLPGYGLGWGFNYCYWMDCSLLWNWQFTPPSQPFYEYTPPPPVVSTYLYPTYEYGAERRDSPQLFLKDGTVYNVIDYWRVDDQLHFTIIEPGNATPAEHVISLNQVDLQKTINVNTARGFRFVMRDEPMEQYEHDHPNQVPPAWPQPNNQ